MATDYISRDSALRAVVDAVELYPHEYDAITKEIDFIPAEDVRPVVYCKDCKHSDIFRPDCTEATFPLKCLSVRYGGVFPLWFCEHGERKEGVDLRKVVEIDQVKEDAE